MKVTSTISPMPAREPVRPAGERKSFSVSTTETTGTTEQPAPVASKTVPSGLQRVLERLQDMPVANLTKGQANAMQHIERNIARYRDHHGIADAVTTPTDPVPGDPAVTPTPTPVETPEAPVATDPANTAPAPVTTPETPAEPPIAAPETPIAAPVAETPAETPIAAPVAQAPAETPVTTPEAPIAAPVAETPAEAPAVPVAATEPAPVEAPVDGAAAIPTAPVVTPELSTVEASLIDSLPPAGSVIDMQA